MGTIYKAPDGTVLSIDPGTIPSRTKVKPPKKKGEPSTIVRVPVKDHVSGAEARVAADIGEDKAKALVGVKLTKAMIDKHTPKAKTSSAPADESKTPGGAK